MKFKEAWSLFYHGKDIRPSIPEKYDIYKNGRGEYTVNVRYDNDYSFPDRNIFTSLAEAEAYIEQIKYLKETERRILVKEIV